MSNDCAGPQQIGYTAKEESVTRFGSLIHLVYGVDDDGQ